MPLPSLGAITRRLRKRWLFRAARHQRTVLVEADFDLEHHRLKTEFNKRRAVLQLREIEALVALIDEEEAEAARELISKEASDAAPQTQP